MLKNVAAAIISISVAQVLAFLIVLMCWSKCSAPWTSHYWKKLRWSSINWQRRLRILWWYFSLPRSSLLMALKKQFPPGSIRLMRLSGVWELSLWNLPPSMVIQPRVYCSNILDSNPKEICHILPSSSVEELRSFSSRDGGWTCSRMGSWLLLRVDLHVEESGFVRQAAGFDFDVEGIWLTVGFWGELQSLNEVNMKYASPEEPIAR